MLRFDASGKLLAIINKFGNDAPSFNLPISLVFDSQGNLYVAEASNSRVQRFNALR